MPVAGALLALKLALALGEGYVALCSGPVDTYPVLAAARDSARNEARAAQAGAALPYFALAWAGTLDVALQLKQSDPLAFPAHVVAGVALEVGGCPVSATGDQWRKAAGHAWADAPARVAADGLARTMGSIANPATVLETLRRYDVEEPWHGANLERVERAYQR